MSYKVKEVFKTIQGEGFQSGRTAILCRFTGCNLWSGYEKHRANATCRFCDTDFIGTNGLNGGSFSSADSLANHIENIWGTGQTNRFVVLTGGEPMLQVDKSLILLLKRKGFYVAIETNGSLNVPSEVDWICVSPKSGVVLKQTHGSELKLIYPQDTDPKIYEILDFKYFFLQPMDNTYLEKNMKLSVDYCQKNTLWRLSLQSHKVLGIK